MVHTVSVQDAFGIVLIVVVALGALVAVITFVGVGRVYEQIGRGGLSLRDGTDRPAAEPVSAAVASAEREAEIRQMLAARNERRLRRGQAPIDIDAELAALDRPAPDEALRAEVRQLVVARNERRLRAGKEPLDVEAEVERQLRELM
jgi:hypothetical protein